MQQSNAKLNSSVKNINPMDTTKKIKVNQDDTFNPNTILIKPSDRKLQDSFDKTENIKFVPRNKLLSNSTSTYSRQIKPLKVNANELPVASYIPNLPAHQLLKNISTVNLQTRMLFDRNNTF